MLQSADARPSATFGHAQGADFAVRPLTAANGDPQGLLGAFVCVQSGDGSRAPVQSLLKAVGRELSRYADADRATGSPARQP